MSNFKGVIERIRSLETERKNILLEIEELKKMADSKAEALENEVSMLREEVKSLRVLLSGEEPQYEPTPKKKGSQK
jgi:regulator of replication initiation timing